MNEESYLNPLHIREQSDGAICMLQKDNVSLDAVESSLDIFAADEKLKSEAFQTLRQQIRDYKMILQSLRLANESDIMDHETLRVSVGYEVLDGKNILTQQSLALSAKAGNEASAASYRAKQSGTNNIFMKMYYAWKAGQYDDLAAADQRLYEAWLAKEVQYDEIEQATAYLFGASDGTRKAVEAGLADIGKVFQAGEYKPNMTSIWRDTLSAACNEMTGLSRLKTEFGLSDGEMANLERQGIQITLEDVRNMKKTIDTDAAFVTQDRSSILYKGGVYPIYVPTQDPTIGPCWVTDGIKEKLDIDFSLLGGMLGFDTEEVPKDELRTKSNMVVQDSTLSSKDKNVKEAAALSAFVGLMNFVDGAFSSQDITIVFESAPGGCKRAVIGVGSSEQRKTYQNMNYNLPINTYQSSEGVMGKKWASDYAAGVYYMATGEEVPDKDAAYTITGTLDERHSQDSCFGYLSYSEDKELIYTPIVYPGDSGQIAACKRITGNSPATILDFTDKLDNPSLVDDGYKRLFEKALED